MKTINRLIAILFAATAAVCFAQSAPAPAPITLQDEIELYNAITSLDKGTVKMVEGKPQAVPFVFSAATRFALGIDASLVKIKAEAYQNTATAIKAQIDPKGSPDKPAENGVAQAMTAALMPLYTKADPTPPAFQRIPLADLNLDANPIPLDTLTKLRLIIQQ